MSGQAFIEARDVDSWSSCDHGQYVVAPLKSLQLLAETAVLGIGSEELFAETCVLVVGTEELLSETCDLRSKGVGFRRFVVACALSAGPGGGPQPLTALIVGHWARCCKWSGLCASQTVDSVDRPILRTRPTGSSSRPILKKISLIRSRKSRKSRKSRRPEEPKERRRSESEYGEPRPRLLGLPGRR